MREETFAWYIFYSIDTFIIFLLMRIYLFIDTISHVKYPYIKSVTRKTDFN